MANDENLRPPWKPGESGNPNGRKKGSRNRSTIAREVLAMTFKVKDPMKLLNSSEFEDLDLTDEQVQMIEDSGEMLMTLAQLAKAIKDQDTNAYKALLDSAHGTPKQTIEHTEGNKRPARITYTDEQPQNEEEE